LAEKVQGAQSVADKTQSVADKTQSVADEVDEVTGTAPGTNSEQEE
jgi:hypothetical protein